MKIAIIQRRMDRLGGAERLVHDLAHGLASKGHQVDFFVYKYEQKYWGRIEDQKYKIHFLRLSLIPRVFRLFIMGLYFRFKLKNYDLINIHNTYVHHWMIFAALFNKRHYPPIVWYCNEPRRETYYDVLEPEQLSQWKRKILAKYRLKALGRLRAAWQIFSYRFLDKYAVRSCKIILANSHYAGRQIEKAFGVRPRVCHAGIRLAGAEQQPAYSQPYALLVSRMEFHKNVDGVLRAWANLKGRGINRPKLLLVGKGQNLGALKSLAAQLNLDNDVEFLGYVEDATLENLYAHADFFIYIPIREPFGLTLIEAMKHGVPVIGADDGGATEIVDHEASGLLVNPRDEKAVASAMERMMADAAMRSRMGEAARKKVMAYYSLDKFVERFENVCAEIGRP